MDPLAVIALRSLIVLISELRVKFGALAARACDDFLEWDEYAQVGCRHHEPEYVFESSLGGRLPYGCDNAACSRLFRRRMGRTAWGCLAAAVSGIEDRYQQAVYRLLAPYGGRLVRFAGVTVTYTRLRHPRDPWRSDEFTLRDPWLSDLAVLLCDARNYDFGVVQHQPGECSSTDGY